ncbi:MAG: hypothetical protein ACOCZB_08200, partial [Spirochaetota bacterium]
NAVEHGNCGITYEEKSAYLAGDDDSLDLIRERIRDPAVAAREVYLSYRIAPKETVVTITDEGRGILMAQAYIDDLSYNDAGKRSRYGILLARLLASRLVALHHLPD